MSGYKYDAAILHCDYKRSYKDTGSDLIDGIKGYYVQYIKSTTFNFTGFMNEKLGDCEDASALYHICCILQGQDMYLCRVHNNDMVLPRISVKMRPVFWFGRPSYLPYDNKMIFESFHQFGFVNGTVFDPTFRFQDFGAPTSGVEDGYASGVVPSDFINLAVDPAFIQQTDFKYDTFVIDEVK